MVDALMEGMIVALIVGTVGFIAGRSLYRTLTGKAPACRFCSSGGCGGRVDGVQSGCLAEIGLLKRKDGA
ncbi:MAG: hypothetical protein A4E73_03811 [Syntrophaceae bacterium PtaU1.Bin231]|nr:MAG: hypothetical protein A4E73_03811 [Syntrophaceae bacterium PtaU1.Bin231]